MKEILKHHFTVLSITLGLFLAGYLAGTNQPLDDTRVIKRFNQIYYETNLWSEVKWLGIQSWQTPTDNWIMQEMITDLKPDYIVEVGTAEGGTTLFYADILSQINPNGKIITVDIDNTILPQVKEKELFKKYVEFIQGDSVSPEVLSKISAQVKGKKVLITLDSSHEKDHVLKELPLYADMVPIGSYLVVQDTNLNGHPVYPGFGPGPWEALQEFLKTDHRFEIDHSKEKFMLTFYPGGYLKRIY